MLDRRPPRQRRETCGQARAAVNRPQHEAGRPQNNCRRRNTDRYRTRALQPFRLQQAVLMPMRIFPAPRVVGAYKKLPRVMIRADGAILPKPEIRTRQTARKCCLHWVDSQKRLGFPSKRRVSARSSRQQQLRATRAPCVASGSSAGSMRSLQDSAGTDKTGGLLAIGCQPSVKQR